ncbi:membrane dipeptidase [Dysgonomonas sp. 520]|uniref:membrane dipeptidase n=1 Tax=Dysgonomonas sp. 520 TaxID=2302931 RepID=UPI0013D23851|nr:membrane dipeptidase [Dysgonomonas sp. 520]NDW09116.1 fused gamma-glutamyl-gamma-aminobutyrate hydrolase/peptidase [Dysgonomonas sp. 520]
MKKIFFTCILSLIGIYSLNAQGKYNLKDVYKQVDAISASQSVTKIKPLIGLSASNSRGASRLSGAYTEAVIKAGGIPIIVPVTTDTESMLEVVKMLDGLILTGGGDVHPSFYKEKPMANVLDLDSLRDDYELKLLRLASNRNVPILGICRGEQLINVAFGGTLYQDIPSQMKTEIVHKQTEARSEATHSVIVADSSKLAEVLGRSGEFQVNTFHHQAVKDIAPGFKVTAVSSDGVIEAIESYPNRSILAIQWHPEAMAVEGNKDMLRIFNFFVTEADVYRQAKEMHTRILSVDSHTDTPLCFNWKNFNIARRDSNQVNLPKMQEGMLDGVYMAAYIRQGNRDKVSSEAAVRKVDGLINGILKQVKMNENICGIAATPQDIIRLKDEGKKAIFVGIENGYGIGKDINNLKRFRDKGVTYMTLCHTTDNDICDTSSRTKKEWGGLSPFGKEVIKEMNRIGMMIDVSHAGESTFWDVIELSSKPIIASHSSARALCDHDRNLTDRQLKGIAKNGGVVQVCLVNMFTNKDRKKANLDDVINHIDHIVKIAGIDHVGIGSDFDGGGGVIGCESANDLINITVKLIERGYTEDEISKIWGGNLLRVMKEVQNV